MRPADIPVTLAVLAGGQGSRMGQPKSLLSLHGQPILAYLLDQWDWKGPTLLVTAPGCEHPPAATRFDREAVDPVEGLGPLRGLLTALQSAPTPIILVTTVDMPCIRPAQLQWLVSTYQSYADANPNISGLMLQHPNSDPHPRIEPFPSIFHQSAASIVEARLQARQSSVHSLSQVPGIHAVDADWPAEGWVNLNHPQDLAQFERARE